MMEEHKSLRELMEENPAILQRYRDLDAELGKGAKDIERMMRVKSQPTDRSNNSRFSFSISPEGRHSMNICARLWNITVPSLIRIALNELMSKYGFDTNGVLMRKDYFACDVSDGANGPFQTKDEAKKKRHERMGWDVPIS